MNFNLNEAVDKVNLSDFEILEVNRTDDFVLITAKKECLVYFAFFKNFIVCSGDYGEWVFDCTWQTTQRDIPGSAKYLYGKLSRNAKALIYDRDQAKLDLARLHSYIKETYDEELTKSQKQKFEEAFDDFADAIADADEYRIVTIVDEYIDDVELAIGTEFDIEERSRFYSIGEAVNHYLVVNLAMLNKIREDNILFGEGNE